MTQPSRIYFDVSYTRTQPGNVGITRTVRRLLEALQALHAETGAPCVPVSFHSQGFRETVEPVAAQRARIEKSRLSRLYRWLSAGPVRRAVEACLPLAALHGAWAFTSQLTFDALSADETPVRFQAGDWLVLADECWNYRVWEGAARARAQGAKVLLVVYDLIPLRQPEFCSRLFTYVFKPWLQQTLANCDAALCISQSTQTDLLRFCEEQGLAPVPSGHFRLGSDIPRASQGESRKELRRFLGQELPCFTAVGTIEPRKNHRLLLTVFGKLWAQGVQVRLLIIGRVHPACHRLAQEMRRHSKAGRLLLLVEDASDAEVNLAYSQSRALLFASLAEGFGLPLVEAQARGCPVIASDLPALQELADEGVAFFRRNSGNDLERLVREHAGSPRPPARGGVQVIHVARQCPPIRCRSGWPAFGQAAAGPRRGFGSHGAPAMTRLSGSVAAGTASSLVSVAAAILATPLYLRYLGSEGYGVLGFVLTLQASLLVLDGGIGISITREVAQRQERHSRQTIDLVYGLARVNVLIAVVLAVAVASLASVIANSWLNRVSLDATYVTQSLAMAGLAIGSRWPLALYQSALVGMQKMVPLSVASMVMTVISTGGAVILLAHGASDLRLMFAWLSVAAWGQSLWYRHLVNADLGPGRPPPAGRILDFYRQSAAAGGLGIVGALVMQLDKVVLSRILSLDVFGHYIMATLIAGAIDALVTPVFHVIYPQLCALAIPARRGELEQAYRSSSLMLASFLFPVTAAAAFFSVDVLLVWTADPAIADAVAPLASLLCLGSGLHGIMFVPYALKLACGATKLALAISIALLGVSLPLITGAAVLWGATGAAAAWLVLHLLYVAFGSLVTHRAILPGIGWRWLAGDLGVPALVSVCVVSAGSWWTHRQAWTAGASVGFATLLVLCCWVGLVLSSKRMRNVLRAAVRRSAQD